MRVVDVLWMVVTAVGLASPVLSGSASGGQRILDRTEAFAPAPLTLHTYEARIRLSGRVSTTTVQARDAGHAKQLVRAQYGDRATVLSVRRID